MRRLAPDQDLRRFAERLVLVVVAVGLVVLLYRVSDLLLLAFGAMLGALLLSTVADWVARTTGWPRGVGVALAALLLFGVLGLIGWLFGAETGRQAAQLRETLPEDFARLQARLAADPIGRMVLASTKQGAGGTRVAALITGGGWGVVQIAANFLIVLIGAIFFAAQPGVYRRGLTLLAPPPYRGVATAALDDLARSLRLWLLTQLISMTMMGIMIGCGLWWSGLEGWAALGLLGGLSEFIPFIGPTLAMIPAILVALVGKGSIAGVLVTYLVVRIVQVQIITPLISQRAVSVPAGLYLFLILAMGAAFGAFGMFFAGALSVAGYTLAIRLWERETLGEDVALPGT